MSRSFFSAQESKRYCKSSHCGPFVTEHLKRNNEHPCPFYMGVPPKGQSANKWQAVGQQSLLGTVLHFYQNITLAFTSGSVNMERFQGLFVTGLGPLWPQNNNSLIDGKLISVSFSQQKGLNFYCLANCLGFLSFFTHVTGHSFHQMSQNIVLNIRILSSFYKVLTGNTIVKSRC